MLLSGGRGIDVERFCPQLNVWISVAPLPRVRCSASWGVWNGFIYVFGGNDVARTVPVERFDPKNDTWVSLSPIPRKCGLIHANSICTVDEGFYLFGTECVLKYVPDDAVGTWWNNVRIVDSMLLADEITDPSGPTVVVKAPKKSSKQWQSHRKVCKQPAVMGKIPSKELFGSVAACLLDREIYFCGTKQAFAKYSLVVGGPRLSPLPSLDPSRLFHSVCIAGSF